MLAGGDVNATALGALGNAGRLIAGVGDDGALSLPGSVKLTAAFITHPGISAAGKDLSLAAAGMDLSGGNLSAVGKLALASPGDIATRNAVVHGGTLDIAAANLRNQGGKLTSAGDAALKLGGELDNAAGLIAAAGGLRIEAGRVGNAAGTLAGADVAIAATGAVDNRGGLIQADESLTLNAAALDNSATLAAPGTPAKGVLGKLVAIMADRVNNQGGSVGAGQDLTLTTGNWTTPAAKSPPRRNATVRAALLKNTPRASCSPANASPSTSMPPQGPGHAAFRARPVLHLRGLAQPDRQHRRRPRPDPVRGRRHGQQRQRERRARPERHGRLAEQPGHRRTAGRPQQAPSTSPTG